MLWRAIAILAASYFSPAWIAIPLAALCVWAVLDPEAWSDLMDMRKEKPMPDYRVSWETNVTADTPEEAAREAFFIMQKPGTTATVFTVHDEGGNHIEVDLEEAGPVIAATAELETAP